MSKGRNLLLSMLLLPVTLAAQITFAEKPQEKGPGWEYMRDIIMMPYDSTQLLIETYPILEAYRKYIGQQIFFMKGSDSDENVIHKYYEIVDVISYKKFLETESQKNETKQREKEKELRERQKAIDERTPKLRERENELNKTKTELEQDYKKKGSTEDDLRNIEWRFQEIEKRRQIQNLSSGGQKDLRDEEKELRKREKVLLKNYEREKVLKELSEIENKLSEIEKELIETKKELIETGKESTKIKDDLRGIQNYFNVYESNQRKKRATDMIKQKTYFFPCEDNTDKRCNYEIENEDIPYFVLKNTQTKDTIYRAISTGYDRREDPREEKSDCGIILVSGFLKLKDLIGQNVVRFHDGGSGSAYIRIEENWKIVDVSIADGNYIEETYYSGREGNEHISFVLKNQENGIVKNYRVSNITKKFIKNNGYIQRGYALEKDWKEYKSYRDQLTQQSNQQTAQAKAKRKQELTAKYGSTAADKIIAGKLEIGMSKAVCKEIVGYAAVSQKTATTETWKVTSFWTGGVAYLYFTGDKLARIVNR
jgi:hypothetical protein